MCTSLKFVPGRPSPPSLTPAPLSCQSHHLANVQKHSRPQGQWPCILLCHRTVLWVRHPWLSAGFVDRLQNFYDVEAQVQHFSVLLARVAASSLETAAFSDSDFSSSSLSNSVAAKVMHGDQKKDQQARTLITQVCILCGAAMHVLLWIALQI